MNKKRTFIMLVTLTAAIAFIWFLPQVDETANRIIMGWIAGWQLGGWAWTLGDWIDGKLNDK